MPQLMPPEVKPVLSDIELFAQAYFNIKLTRHQLQVIDAMAKGKNPGSLRISRFAGITTAQKVAKAYLAEGLLKGGRRRLPQHPLPPRAKFKGGSQESRILSMIKRPGGAYNFELSRIALKYTSVISELRKEGYDIIADRQYLKNGKASNTYRYRLAGQ